MGKKLIACKSCGHEVAKSAKKCPSCGAKLKMGCLIKSFILLLIILIVVPYIIGKMAPSLKEEKEKEQRAKIAEVISAIPDSSISQRELAQAFNVMSKATDVQREKLEKEIAGKFVQWNYLKVFEVRKSEPLGYYTIHTSRRENKPSTILHVYSLDLTPDDIDFIEGLKTGDLIDIKGKITEKPLTFFRSIELDPVIIVR